MSIRGIITRVNVILAVVAAVLLFAATLILTWMVLIRTLGFQTSWELEASIELMIAGTFLASPYTLAVGGHVKMDLAAHLIRDVRVAKWLRLFTEVLGCAACLYIGYAAVQMTIGAYVSGERALGVWQPLAWPKYSTVAIGMLLTAVQYFVEFSGTIRSDKHGDK